MDSAYVQTVRLLLETAPVLFSSPEFVMKGGTAINLFVEDMPRRSVNIDVVWKDHATPREEAMQGIAQALQRSRQGLEQKRVKLRMSVANKGEETKLFVERENRQVKIEVNHVFRGTVLAPEQRRLVKTARDLFTTDLTVPVLATPELYGSKIVAALDRQHPRDIHIAGSCRSGRLIWGSKRQIFPLPVMLKPGRPFGGNVSLAVYCRLPSEHF